MDNNFRSFEEQYDVDYWVYINRRGNRAKVYSYETLQLLMIIPGGSFEVVLKKYK
jgi:hypothetical protein